MTDPKFTKGPWFVKGYEIQSAVCSIELAKVTVFNEGKANAHLIASGPSLYYEIQTDIDKLKLKLKFKTGNDEAKLLIELDISRKESLLSKARGE